MCLKVLRQALPVGVHDEAVVVDVDVLGGVVDIGQLLDAVDGLDVEDGARLVALGGAWLGHDLAPASVEVRAAGLEAGGAKLADELPELVLRLRVRLPLIRGHLAQVFDHARGGVLAEPFALHLLYLLPLHQCLLIRQLVAGDEDLLALSFVEAPVPLVSGAVGRLGDLPQGNVRVEGLAVLKGGSLVHRAVRVQSLRGSSR